MEGTYTNEERALRAAHALSAYGSELCSSPDDGSWEEMRTESVFRNLLTDLRHLALDLDLDYMTLSADGQACFESEQAEEFRGLLARALPEAQR